MGEYVGNFYSGKRLDMMGIGVDNTGAGGIHAFIKETADKGGKAIVLNVNVHCVVLALRNKWLFDFLNRAEMVFCDGDGVRWGFKILGSEVPPKTTYDRWIWQLSEFCAANGLSMYFLGAKPGVAVDAAEKLREKYPALKIAGAEHGHFSHEGPENDAVVARINAARPDVLVLAFGMPLQEKWLMRNAEKTQAHIFLTGGAVFDYASGRAKRAPEWMIRAHLEWLFRMLREPRRLFMRYALELPYFFFRVICFRIQNRFKPKSI